MYYRKQIEVVNQDSLFFREQRRFNFLSKQNCVFMNEYSLYGVIIEILNG